MDARRWHWLAPVLGRRTGLEVPGRPTASIMPVNLKGGGVRLQMPSCRQVSRGSNTGSTGSTKARSGDFIPLLIWEALAEPGCYLNQCSW